MANTDLELFMQKLKRLIDNDSIPLIRRNPLIKSNMHEIKLLYEELGYLIGSSLKYMTTDEEQFHLHELEYMGNLKKRVMDIAHEAENIVDMFISSAILSDNEEGGLGCPSSPLCDYELEDRFLDKGLLLHKLEYMGNRKRRVMDIAHEAKDINNMFIYSANINKERGLSCSSSPLCDYELEDIFLVEGHAIVLDCSLNLKDVMDDIKSVKKYMKLESQAASPQVAGTSSTRNSARVLNPSVTEHVEVIVGLDKDAMSIMDRLAGDRKQLDIISIVGMGGLGKTTLATKLFNDGYVVYHFHVRGWVTVSQAYTKRDLLMGILESMGKSVHETTTEPKLCEMLYKSLKGRRYLIVIDDIWSAKAWNELRLYFPDDHTGSRILLTTRLTEVPLHASQVGFTHNLRCLTEEESWELLCRKTFRGYECPKSLIEIGKHIARKCRGLPLAIVVIAGLLEKGKMNKDLWKKVAESVSSYVVKDPNGCLDMLALSYDHLPRHLRNCFLYVGGFPEDCKIQVWRLIRLWMAEGFIAEAGQRTLEEQAEDYLMDLVDRNLLIAADRRSDGGIRSCRLHDLLRELCLKKATEENFFRKIIGKSDHNPFSDSTFSIEKHHRLFSDYKVLCEIPSNGSITHIRSVLCNSYRRMVYRPVMSGGEGSSFPQIEDTTISWVPSFLLLRVLDILNCQVDNLSGLDILIHLRYLAIWPEDRTFSHSLGNLWSLQTLLVKGKRLSITYPLDKMVNLRHLWSETIISIDSHRHASFNLQSIARLNLDGGSTEALLRSFPNIKKLACSVPGFSRKDSDLLNFALLTHLEALTVRREDYGLPWKEIYTSTIQHQVHRIRFPETLKKLTLEWLHLPWTCMSTIQQLPKLEVLKLLDSSFMGDLWSCGDEQFHQLKFLKLHKLDIELWEMSSINFPRLRKLVVGTCKNLREIPLEIGDISTLEHIEIARTNYRLLDSINRIQEEQHAWGNDDIHVKFIDLQPDEVFFNGDPFYE